QPYKVAILSSFAAEFMHAPLAAYGFANGLDIEIYQAGFDQFRQEILNPNSRLYAWAPDIVILAVEGMQWIPELYINYAATVQKGMGKIIAARQDELRQLLQTFRNHSSAPLLVHNFALPPYADFGILDNRLFQGQVASV